jgi:hypothetical protein
MHHTDIDPSLRASEPLLDSLDDGFSPPAQQSAADREAEPALPVSPEDALGAKSPF